MCDSDSDENRTVEDDQALEAMDVRELGIEKLSIQDPRMSQFEPRFEHQKHMRTTPTVATPTDFPLSRVEYVQYTTELQMPDIMRLMKADLSEPYSIYTYRYFIHNWPHLCLLVKKNCCITCGCSIHAIVCV